MLTIHLLLCAVEDYELIGPPEFEGKVLLNITWHVLHIHILELLKELSRKFDMLLHVPLPEGTFSNVYILIVVY